MFCVYYFQVVYRVILNITFLDMDTSIRNQFVRILLPDLPSQYNHESFKDLSSQYNRKKKIQPMSEFSNINFDYVPYIHENLITCLTFTRT